MEAQRQLIIIGSIAIYMVACIAIGLWALRRTKSTSDFFMAGRHLGFWITGLAVFSTTLSAFGFVGGPGLVYRMGMSSVWMIICSSIGFCLSFYLLGKRLRLFAEARNTISLPAAVAARYGHEGTRFFTAIAILFGVFGYLGTQILGMAVVLRQVLTNTGWFGDDIGLHICMIVSVFVLVFYCVTGGIIASVYTDMIQGAIMAASGVVIMFTAMNAVEGGLPAASRIIMENDPEAMGPWGTLGIMGCLSWYFLFALGGAGQPHIVTKMMMNKKVSDAKRILVVSILGYSFAAFLWIAVGLAMRALVLSGKHPELATPDDAAPAFLQAFAHPIVAGIVFAGLFSAIMSTADSFLNIGAAAIIHDIPKSFGRKPPRQELLWARIVTLLLAVVSGLFAYYLSSNGDLVALMGAFGWGTFAAALVPTVAIGMNWKRANPYAAIAAIVSSLSINFLIKLTDFTIPYGIDGGAASLIVSLALFFGLSYALPQQKLDPDIEAIMDM